MASLTLINPSTAYPQLGVALFVVGVGLGLAYTVANDVILASVRPDRAGAAAAISETAYELGMALGIAMLGSIVAGVYRGLAIPPGTLDVVASHAKESLGAAHEAAGTLPADKAHALLAAAQSAFTEGLAIAAGVGSALLLASAGAVWLLVDTAR
jgi:MFS transporter, DHA2 family, multidrug resistance protein